MSPFVRVASMYSLCRRPVLFALRHVIPACEYVLELDRATSFLGPFVRFHKSI